MSWLYHRPTDGTVEYIHRKFAKTPEIAQANELAFKAGWAYGETSEDFAALRDQAGEAPTRDVPQHHRQPGAGARARRGKRAERAAALPRRLPDHACVCPSQDLSRHKNFGVRTFQAEDEIAAAGAALGASFGGALAV